MEFPNRIGMKSARKALFCQTLTQSKKPYFVATSRSPWPETIIILVFCNCECHKSGILVESNCILVAANCIFIVSNNFFLSSTIIFWSITFFWQKPHTFFLSQATLRVHLCFELWLKTNTCVLGVLQRISDVSHLNPNTKHLAIIGVGQVPLVSQHCRSVLFDCTQRGQSPISQLTISKSKRHLKRE